LSTIVYKYFYWFHSL